MKTFVLLDETLNEYGFWISLAGVDVEQFKKNPVMLWMHNRPRRGTADEVLPIGRWENVRIENRQLLADAVFDDNDEFAARISDKVENGFIKMASVGVKVLVVSSDPKDLKPGQTRETLVKCKLREASIVDIGGLDNALSLAFYDGDDKLISLADNGDNMPIKLLNENNQLNTDMIEMKKTAGLLKLADKATDEEFAAEVEKLQTSEASLKSDNEKLTARIKELEDKDKKAKQDEAISLVDAAVKDGRLDAAGKESFLKLFENNHESAKASLNAIPKRTSVKEELKGSERKLSDVEKLTALSWDELDKQGKLEQLKAADIEAFKVKFQEKFGKEYKS